MPQRRLNRGSKRDGFSLMELMIVVVITSVLAAIALPTFTNYVMKARTAEATQMLGTISLRQESYRAEFGQYLQCNGVVDPDNIAFVPANATTMRNGIKRAFTDTSQAAALACFNTLGIAGGFVRFGYGFAAGTPGTMTNAYQTLYGLTTVDHWFVTQGVTDLDGDGDVCTFEATSFTQGIWIGAATPASALKGWE